MKNFVFAFFLSAFGMLVYSVAWAAAAGAEAPVDLIAVVNGVDGIVAAALALLAVISYGLLSKIPFFNKLVTKEQYQKLIEPLLDQAVAYGVGKLKDADWLKVSTKNEAIDWAIKYAVDHGGDLLKKFGISEEILVEKLEAKLVANGWDVHPGKWV